MTHVLNLTGDFRGGLLEAPLYPLKPDVSRGPPGLSGGPGPLGPPRNSTTAFSMRITNGWNSLPFSVVTDPAVNSFKK